MDTRTAGARWWVLGVEWGFGRGMMLRVGVVVVDRDIVMVEGLAGGRRLVSELGLVIVGGCRSMIWERKLARALGQEKLAAGWKRTGCARGVQRC